jgi:hypothetical protein
VYVVDPGGYVGFAGAIECGYAHALRIPIYYSHPPFESAAIPGQTARPLAVLQGLSRDQLPPADVQLLDDYVRGHALHVGREGAQLSLQGAEGTPVLAHRIAGPLAIRREDRIELRPASSAHHSGMPYRVQLLTLAHKHQVPTREERS